MGYIETWIPPGVHSRALIVLSLYKLPPTENKFLCRTNIIYDDTSVIISNRNFRDFSSTLNIVLSRMIEWFAANKLVLNLEKTNIMKSVTNNSPHCALTIGYKHKYIEEAVTTKFLGMHFDNHLNWKDHTDLIIPKLSAACCTVRQMYHTSNSNTLKSIYFAIYSIEKCGIIFWGNLSNSRKIFSLQKKIIRIMVGAHPRTSCRRLFKK